MTPKTCPLSPGCGCARRCRAVDLSRPVHGGAARLDAAYRSLGLWLCGLVAVSFLAGFIAGRF